MTNPLRYVPGMTLDQTIEHLWGDTARREGNKILVTTTEEDLKKNLASCLMALTFADGRDFGMESHTDGVATISPVEYSEED